jgi:Rad3-related DNA helicase
LVSLVQGRAGRCCPYFTASKIAETADLIFAPYIYLIDPVIRNNSSVSLTNAIIILDEAHNIEDTCRSAASFEVILFVSVSLCLSLSVSLSLSLSAYLTISPSLLQLFRLHQNNSKKQSSFSISFIATVNSVKKQHMV